MRRTTVRLDDGLLEQAKREAQRRGVTLTALIEMGLRQELARPKGARKRIELPVSKCGGGIVGGLDLTNNAAVLDYLDENLPLHKLR